MHQFDAGRNVEKSLPVRGIRDSRGEERRGEMADCDELAKGKMIKISGFLTEFYIRITWKS